jgi:VWFA-related protein
LLFMRTRPLAFATAVVAPLLPLFAQSPAPQTFRAGTDIVPVDVSVLDKNRRPVRGLTAADFTVFEDGQPRPLVVFSAVDLPEAPAPAGAAWTRDVAPDVASNALPDEGRLVVILLDRSIPAGRPTVTARDIAKAAIDALGPGDLAAVAFTGGGTPQDFTADRGRLLRAIDVANPGRELPESFREVDARMRSQLAELGITLPDVDNTGACYCGLCVMESITHVANSVRDVPRRRKALLFIGTNIAVQSVDPDCGSRLSRARETLFDALDLANLTVHAIDPMGLESLALGADSVTTGRDVRGALAARAPANLVRQGNIGVLPDRTGGRTVVNAGDPAVFVRDVIRESDSYYVLGFRPAHPSDRRRHDIRVRVDRRGVAVTSRRAYEPDAARAPASPASDGSPALQMAIGGAMPKRAGLAVSATAAAFAGLDGQAVVAVTVGVRPDRPAPGGAARSPVDRTVNVITLVLNAFGQPAGALKQSVVVSKSGPADPRYELVQRLPLSPGRYELRIAVDDTSSNQAGSVYTYVDVPTFREGLWLSNVVLSTPAPRSVGGSDLSDVLPVLPTVRREFARDERVSAFARVYGSQSPEVPPTVTARIIDERDQVRLEQRLPLTTGAAGRGRSFDYRLDLPLTNLQEGSYLLSIEAAAGRTAATRRVRFAVQ